MKRIRLLTMLLIAASCSPSFVFAEFLKTAVQTGEYQFNAAEKLQKFIEKSNVCEHYRSDKNLSDLLFEIFERARSFFNAKNDEYVEELIKKHSALLMHVEMYGKEFLAERGNGPDAYTELENDEEYQRLFYEITVINYEFVSFNRDKLFKYTIIKTVENLDFDDKTNSEKLKSFLSKIFEWKEHEKKVPLTDSLNSDVKQEDYENTDTENSDSSDLDEIVKLLIEDIKRKDMRSLNIVTDKITKSLYATQLTPKPSEIP
ncbi:MAG: hypothetical protein LBP36_01755 [Oscillospiraceae bacterium]|jgi:hypothetical protein|nr:hypothetical protein [Oscillospiraceae bacterium]